jgi:hypothetical protein
MRRWFCRLQLPLVLASAVILGSDILLSQIQDFLEPGESDPRIYIPQEHNDPFISPGTWFRFRRLLRLAGLRWRYWNPSLHGIELSSSLLLCLYHFGTDHIENSSFLVAFVSVAGGTCLRSRCPETALVYPPISRSLHSNGSKRYNMNSQSVHTKRTVCISHS